MTRPGSWLMSWAAHTSRDSSGFFSPIGCTLRPQQGVSPRGFAVLELTPVISVMARTLDDQGRFSA